MVALAMPALLWIWLEPFLLGFRAFGQGLLMRIRSTGPIAVSAVSRVVVVAGSGLLVVWLRPEANGALVGVSLLMLGDGWDMAIACLWGWLRRDALGMAPAPPATLPAA
jgi:O-antigen/teichoic acid export membrane protein